LILNSLLKKPFIINIYLQYLPFPLFPLGRRRGGDKNGSVFCLDRN